MKTFEETVRDHFPKLELYTLPVTRAHGKNHPEVFHVHDVFQEMNQKVSESDSAKPDLTNEFDQLRQWTNNYTIPNDVCETFEAVYTMLEETDRSYHQI